MPRAEVVATAFVSQMDSEAESLRRAKTELENALAQGKDLRGPRVALDSANATYNVASTTIRKHAAAPKPKAKGAAKKAAETTA